LRNTSRRLRSFSWLVVEGGVGVEEILEVKVEVEGFCLGFFFDIAIGPARVLRQ
jgi:hypothetical protein